MVALSLVRIMRLICTLVLLLGLAARPSQPSHLRVAYQWKYLDWVWPNVYLSGKNYTLGNAFTQDVDIDRQGRVFVTSPQWLHGVPISLSLVTKVQGPGGRLLVPYPNWTWHTPFNCDSIVSVYRLAVISRLLLGDASDSGRGGSFRRALRDVATVQNSKSI